MRAPIETKIKRLFGIDNTQPSSSREIVHVINEEDLTAEESENIEDEEIETSTR